MEEKIKNIYNCRPLEGTDTLVKWYNTVIEKKSNELTVSDVARCIRQNLFVETALEMLLVYLLNNPYEGDVYKGEFMDKLSEIDKNYLLKYQTLILEIIEKARKYVEESEWEIVEEKKEFEESIDKVSEMLLNN